MKPIVAMKNSFNMPRMVESEKSESGVSESVPAKATKVKASSAQQKQQQQSQSKGNGDLVRLEKAYRSCQGELTKMQKASTTNARD